MLFQMNICILVSSPGLMAMTFPSTTATAPRVAAATKSLCTLKTARSRSSRSGSVFRGSSRVVCSSSFQSRVCPGMCSS
uniref:Putative secreted protein n=1 Tax=Ixodes ricinus TaxID=34613 RepID=A0A6B0UCI2_IXORI